MRMITLLTLLFLGSAGCSQMRPTAKSQTQTVIAFGLPALAIVSETHMGATNSFVLTNHNYIWYNKRYDETYF